MGNVNQGKNLSPTIPPSSIFFKERLGVDTDFIILPQGIVMFLVYSSDVPVYLNGLAP